MISWENMDTLLIDLDGTLLDLHYDNYIWEVAIVEKYAAKHAISFNAAREVIVSKIKRYSGTIQAYCFSH